MQSFSFQTQKPKNTSLWICFAENKQISSPTLLNNDSPKNLYFQKKFLNGYSKIHELKLVSIGLASPDKIQSWAEKELPNGKIFGEVTNANTFHYRTFQPTKGGLFCERIFGPLKDFECACGKRQKPTAFESKKILEHKQITRYFCSNCDVEYTWSIIRRYQLGYIKLNAPVTHLWYLKTNPSYLSIFFDMKRKDLESIVYCIDSLTLENIWKLMEQKGNFSRPITDFYKIWENSLKVHEQKQTVDNLFVTTKQQKRTFRKKFLKIFQTPSNDLKNLVYVSKNWKQLEKKYFFPLFSKESDLETTSFLLFQSNFLDSFKANEILLSSQNTKTFLQYQIFQNVFEKKEQKILFFLFEESLKKLFQKNSEKHSFQVFSKENFRNQISKSLILLQKFEKKNFEISLFMLFKFFFFFSLKKKNFQKNIFEKNNDFEIEKKQIFLFLLSLIPFLKKLKFFDYFLLHKKNFQYFSSFRQKSFLKKEKDFFEFLKQEDFQLQGLFFFQNFSPLSMNFDNQKNISSFLSKRKIEKQTESLESNSPNQSPQKLGKIQIFNSFNALKHKKIQKRRERKLQQFQKFLNFEKPGKTKPSVSTFLKNPVSTISSYFLWKNDSDWNSFIYYNSFLFSEFDDIPIFYFSSREVFSSFSQNFFSTQLVQSSFRNIPGMKSNFLEYSLFEQKKNSGIFEFQNFQESRKKVSVGAGILEKLLMEYTPNEFQKMIHQHQILLPKLNNAIQLFKQNAYTKKESGKVQKYIQKREHIIRRLKFFRKFSRKNSKPTSMILRNLPVLPPDLRPVLKLQNQIAASDLNRFYQRILYRNERFRKFSQDSVTKQSFEVRYAQRLLQEAVDNLIQNGKGNVKPETNSRGQALKSLSEILKGKQGRFRQYLLGKRVDYSGRSVIVVGPKLKLHECGLPKEIAFELFLPFLIQQIFQLQLAKTVIGAKNLLKKDSDLAFHLLQKIMKNIPILLNRAPTLHRLGFQAFFPKLVEGRAILLHPMVCPGFNADFDGDQMAVHIPLTVEARTEAWKFMLSTNNFINSATGEPILLPTQDMVLGCYYLTTDFQSKASAFQILDSFRENFSRNFSNFQNLKKSFLFFQNIQEVFAAYSRKEIGLHTAVWIRWTGFVDFGKTQTRPIEVQLRKNGSWTQIHPKVTNLLDQKNERLSKFIRTTPGRIFMNLMIQDFQKDNF